MCRAQRRAERRPLGTWSGYKQPGGANGGRNEPALVVGSGKRRAERVNFRTTREWRKGCSDEAVGVGVEPTSAQRRKRMGAGKENGMCELYRISFRPRSLATLSCRVVGKLLAG